MVAEKELGALTGNAIGSLSLSGSNARNLGVRNVKGLSDPYTNYFDSTADSYIAATNGFCLQALVLATVNLVSGVVFDIEADLLLELFSPNSLKTT